MKNLTASERRTVRLGAIALGVYLALFAGLKGFQALARQRAAFEQRQRSAAILRSEVQAYEARAARLQRLVDKLQLDPGKLSTNTVVAQATAALQQAAMAGGVQLGAVRESLNRASEKDLGSIQLDAAGPPPALLAFVARIERIGFPVVVDSVQFTSDPRGPGMLKVHLNLVVLDFEQWKARPHA